MHYSLYATHGVDVDCIRITGNFNNVSRHEKALIIDLKELKLTSAVYLKLYIKINLNFT